VATGRRDRSPNRVRAAAPFVAGVAVAGLLLGLAVASGALYVSSIGSALLARELDPVGGERAVVFDVRTGGTPTAEELDRTEATLLDQTRARDLPDPELQLLLTTLVTEVPAGEREVAILGLPGAEDHMQPVVQRAEVDPGLPTVTVTGYTAAILEVEVGTELEIESGDSSVVVAIDRIVEDYVWGSIPAFWQPVSFYLAVNPDPTPGLPPPPPSLLVDTEVARELLAALDLEWRVEVPPDNVPADATGAPQREGDLHLLTEGGLAEVTWRVRLDGPPTLDQMRRIAPEVEALRGEAVTGQSLLGSELRTLGRFFDQPSPPIVGGQVGPVVERVEASLAGLRTPVAALALLGQVLALGVLAAAVVTTGRARLARARLWAVRGIAPSRLALRWTTAVVVPLVLGIGLGWWFAPTLVARIGEGPVDPAAHLDVWPQLLVATAAAALVVFATVAVVARRRAATDRAERSVPPVAEVVAVLLLGLAAWQVRGRETFLLVDGEGRVSLDLLAVALPFVLVVAVAVLGVRLLRVAAARLASSSPDARGWWFLATRRLRSLGGATVALAVVSATSVGVLVAAGALAASSEATVEEKTRVAVGADAAAALPRSSEGRARLELASVPAVTTEVVRMPEVLLGERTEVDVLAVDPATFAAVAYQPAGLDVPVADLLGELTATPDGAATAIVVEEGVGGSDGSRGSALRVEGIDLPIELVARVPTFPGATGERPLVVVSRDDLLDPDDTATWLRIAYATDPELWLAGEVDSEVARSALQTAGLDLERVVSAGDLIDDPATAPLTWTFTFLRAQAAVLATVGLLSLVAHHVARRRAQALATAFARRMGLGRGARLMADAVELALLLGATVGLGIGSGLAAARVVLPQYDPLPGNALPSVFVAPDEVVTVLLGASLALLVVAVVTTARRMERVEVATLLRGEP
jgi:hypothetical protein